MREIKFRAWDKELKVMYKVFGIDVNHVIPFRKGVPIGPTREQTVLMQYTGIKDVKGKGIYEGDIVLYNDNTGYTGVVYYDEAETSYMIKPIGEGEYEVLGLTCNVTVIGNIFKNTELLEVAE